MIPSLDTKTDKIIIIGFTGPLASGCTTLAKFIEDEFYDGHYGISNFLLENGYIEDIDAQKITYTEFDKTINKLLYMLEENIKIGSDDIKKLSDYNYTIKILEEREYANSLDYLLKDNFYGITKRLRISCSGIILFDLVRNLKKLNSYRKYIPEHKFPKVKLFYDTLVTILNNNNISKVSFNKVYNNIVRIFQHKGYSMGTSKEAPYDTEEIDKCFEEVAIIRKNIYNVSAYRELMQDFGDNLRSMGNPFHYPDRDWILKNKNEFRNNNYSLAKYIDYVIHFYANSKKEKTLFLIDSFRNPQCIDYLRRRYPRFYLISVLSPEDFRRRRVDKHLSAIEFKKQDMRDKGENIKEAYEQYFMQNVDKTVELSDISINNDSEGKLKLFKSILRYIALIFDPGCTKPTDDERLMNMAYSMALKSNCISRQVGAVIEGKEGYVVGAGWNDVGEGQISCGLRHIKDLRYDQYKYLISAINEKSGKQQTKWQIIKNLKHSYGRLHYSFCFKDIITKDILRSEVDGIFKKINDSEKYQKKHPSINERIAEIRDTIEKNMNFKGLQYCKALHAEENAIIQGSKIGGMGLVGGKIYTTTFPCELCAKKIQQVGIKEVIYVEPYPKNLSENVYLRDGVKKVKTRQFEGVKGFGYYRLFKPPYSEKDWQSFEKDGFEE